MIHKSIHRFHVNLFGSSPEALGVPVGMDSFILADDADFFVLQFPAISYIVVRAVKMQVIEQ